MNSNIDQKLEDLKGGTQKDPTFDTMVNWLRKRSGGQPFRRKLRDFFKESEIENVCESLWTAHAKWLSDNGFMKAIEFAPEVEMNPEGFDHEVVNALASYIAKTGKVNAHFGLTSSDIIDNARLVQLQKANTLLGNASSAVCLWIVNSFDYKSVALGFTHWQPASRIRWIDRALAWAEPISCISALQPEIYAKQFGGAVGDGKVMKQALKIAIGDQLPKFDWGAFGIENPRVDHPIQSSDFIAEAASISWVVMLAARIHKVAADLRFLCSHGVIETVKRSGVAGSSCMPHKNNPYKLEKVCSICRSIQNAGAEMFEIVAHNGMERTLDGSWQLKQLLEKTYSNFGYAVDTLLSVEIIVRHGRSQSLLNYYQHEATSEELLAQEVIHGKSNSRWVLYLKSLGLDTSKLPTVKVPTVGNNDSQGTTDQTQTT